MSEQTRRAMSEQPGWAMTGGTPRDEDTPGGPSGTRPGVDARRLGAEAGPGAGMAAGGGIQPGADMAPVGDAGPDAEAAPGTDAAPGGDADPGAEVRPCVEEVPRPVPLAASAATAPGDVGRRIAARREELGMTLEATAARAGTAAGYLRYLEEQSTAMPGTSVLIRLADALDTSVAALHGGGADLPPGLGQAADHAELVELGPDECRARLSTHGVGRIATDTPDGLVVLPVNYSLIDGVVTFRTAPGSAPATAVGSRVAFEADHVDEALSQGWSVLVQGRARAVTDPDVVRRLDALAYSGPWAGGEGRDLWVRVDQDRITGRRIAVR
ncbi:helix-turn-helix domain-containing protein [Streptomyces sp. NPDC005046]